MARPRQDRIAVAAETFLRAVSAAAAGATSVGEAMDRPLRVLHEAGWIRVGAVEMYGSPPMRCVVGEEAGLPLDDSVRARLQAERAPGDLGPTLPEGVCVQPMPTRFAPASLFLVADNPLPPSLVEMVAEQMAMALDRACLAEQAQELRQQAERRIREVSTIYEIGRAMDDVELGRLLHLITEKAARVMDAQACSLMRLNPDTNALTIAASYGLSEDVVFVTQRALGEGIAGRVAQTGEPLLIVDAQNDPRLTGVSLRPEIGSSMVVPMKDETGRVVGVLSIRRRRPTPDFGADDLRLFSVFASQAALAISNKQLYDDLHRRVRELSTLSDLTQAVISHLNLDSLLEHLADSIVEVVKFDRCCIFLRDQHTRWFVPRILRGYRPDVIGRNPVRLGEGVVGLVAKKQMPIVESDARNALQPIRGFARMIGANAFLAIPILSKGQAIGVVVADNRLSGRLTRDEDVELLTTFVNQAGIAIENAQLYEADRQRYQEMNRLATQTDNILRSIAASVVVVDAAGRVTRWNKASEVMWGVSEERATQSVFEQLVEEYGLPPEEADRLKALVRTVPETGRPYQGYKIALHPHRRGEMVVNVLLSPLVDQQGERQGVVLIMEDVTHEARMEAEIERMRRLADMGQFAAKMAHEVRNPLSSIKGAAQLMRNEYAELAPLREFLDIIVDEVNGLSKITTDLLDFARPMQLDLGWTNLNHLVERTLQFMANYLRDHRVGVSFHPDETVPDILGDHKQIEQVMRNIVFNAVQAMPEGGALTVTTRYDPEEGTVTARFCDTGIGIASERQEEIFQPFVTTKTKGTGLGLPIVRKIMENHGGRVEVASQVGQGACFSLTFPLRPVVAKTLESVSAVEAAPRTSTLPDM